MRPSIAYSAIFPVDKTTESTCRSTEKLSRREWPRLVSNLIIVNMSIAILPLSQEFNWNSATVGLIHSSFLWGYLLTQVDSNIGSFIAILPMSQEFNWNSATVGLIHFSFFWGYLLTQILGGIWADKISGKLVLGFGVIWWSATIVLTPIAAGVGLPFLLAMRAFMGIGEAKWFPQQLIFTHFSALLDRGWRRSGCFLYKPEMESICCPSYTIRLKASDFVTSKEQLRVSKRMQR